MQNFSNGGGHKEISKIVMLYNSMKFIGELTQKLEKDFQNSETLFCKLLTAWGGMCGPI